MATFSEKGRKMVKAFASPKKTGDDPKKNAYPIDTIEAARKSLAAVERFGSREEKRRVRAAVAKKYPTLSK